MKRIIAEFSDKTINEIKLIVPKPYWAVEENVSFILSKDILQYEGRFKIFLSKQHPLFNMANLAK